MGLAAVWRVVRTESSARWGRFESAGQLCYRVALDLRDSGFLSGAFDLQGLC